MNKLLALTILLVSPVGVSAKEVSKNSGLPKLSEAREIGRSKSALLVEAHQIEKPEGPLKANLVEFKNTIQPVLQNNCIHCHGPKKVKGKFRVDELNPDLLNGHDAAKWLEVYDVLSNAEMPPDDEPDYHLEDHQRMQMIEWLGAEINKASLALRNNSEHSSFRRMTKYEYNYALQDLLGLPHDFAKNLPPESVSEDGFKNSSELLQMSAMQLQKYCEISLKALKQATVLGERPKPLVYKIPMTELEELSNKILKKKKGYVSIDINAKKYQKTKNKPHLINKSSGNVIELNWGLRRGPRHKPEEHPSKVSSQSEAVTLLPSSQRFNLDLGDTLPDEGMMRVRVRVGHKNLTEGGYSNLRVSFGGQTSNNANFSTLITKEDLPIKATWDKPEYVEFLVPLSEVERNVFRRKVEYDANPTEVLTFQHIVDAHHIKGKPPELHIDYIEVTAPYFAQWPTQAHQDIFIESQQKENELTYGKEVLSNFMTKAWRRPVTTKEVNTYFSLFKTYRPEFTNFEETMLHVLSVVLASPDFLYLSQQKPPEAKAEKQPLNAHELATRLSFFLWSSLPDNELLSLAKDGTLKNPKVLDRQIKRLLDDPRAKRFSSNFVNQWLGLDALSNLDLDESYKHIRGHEFKKNTSKEPIAFFNELLFNNKSIMDFIHSDYLVINGYLARHYGIPNVRGAHFRPVAIDAKSKRGGILTTASVLSMNSDGKDSHPLKRGVWLLENILHDPPPPPPANVPEVDLTDPRILKMTLKERMEDHRSNPACISCHKKIDPWGIAFESFDAIGKFRSSIKGKPVDATSTLFNKQKLDGLEGLKSYLLTERQDQFSKAMAHKMISYALGRPLSFSDVSDVDQLTSQFRKKGDRLGDLVSLIIHSKIFQSK